MRGQLNSLFEPSHHSEFLKCSPLKLSKPEDLEIIMKNKIKLREQVLDFPFVIFDKDANVRLLDGDVCHYGRKKVCSEGYKRK